MARLEDLPDEMLVMVSTHCTTEALKGMRLTCRRFDGVAGPEFRRRGVTVALNPYDKCSGSAGHNLLTIHGLRLYDFTKRPKPPPFHVARLTVTLLGSPSLVSRRDGGFDVVNAGLRKLAAKARDVTIDHRPATWELGSLGHLHCQAVLRAAENLESLRLLQQGFDSKLLDWQWLGYLDWPALRIIELHCINFPLANLVRHTSTLREVRFAYERACPRDYRDRLLHTVAHKLELDFFSIRVRPNSLGSLQCFDRYLPKADPVSGTHTLRQPYYIRFYPRTAEIVYKWRRSEDFEM